MKTAWPALLIIVIAVGTPIAATMVFYLSPPAQTTNHGELLEPVALTQQLVPQAGADSEYWQLMTVADAPCDSDCRTRLCMIHQTREVNFGERLRVGRLWLVTGDAELPGQLSMEPACGRDLPAAKSAQGDIDILTGVAAHRASAAQIAALPAPASGKTRASYIYVVDPQGSVMMRFAQQTAVKDIASDMRRLLRLSQRAS